MSRWDYDVVFYRVFCITLLGLAFTFTVILTNVFIDIDGVMKKKTITETTTKEINTNNDDNENTITDFDDTDEQTEDSDEQMYRTKRSSESERNDIKNIGYKKMLTSRLAGLLEELEKQEATTEVTTAAVAKKNLDAGKEELLHLAIHNVLLQGIIEHKDLNNVYKKVHEIAKSFNDDDKKGKDDKHEILEAVANAKEITDMRKRNPINDDKFIDEILNCKQLEKDTEQKEKYNDTDSRRIVTDNKDKRVFIKTVIEINEPEDMMKHVNKTARDNIEGLIKLMYNGKSIEVTQMKDDTVKRDRESSDVELVNTQRNEEEKRNNGQHKLSILNKLIDEYINMRPVIEENAEIKRFKTKRLKRQIKIRYLDEGTTLKPQVKDDDDLYIEIETHYDGKGIIGEKKKKLVRSLIAKIQKALHSGVEGTHEKFIKRTQDPIDSKTPKLLNKMEVPGVAVERRQQDPIDKTLDRHDTLDNLGDPWKKEIDGPRFLSLTKSVNSAEMGEINVDYDGVLKNGIPKRLQVPLNDVGDEDNNNTFDYTEPNNVTLFLKDIDGSGFSIGINQYVGGPPDKASMKMFSGLEDILNEYHKSYDRDVSNESNMDNTDNFVEEHEINKREVNDHKTARSLTEVKTNYKSSYTTIYRNNAFPVQKYINIFKKKDGKKLNDKNFKLNISNINVLSKKLNIRVPLIIKSKVFNKSSSSKNLPFNISRGKRSINVKQISNMKSKIRLNRYLNTKAMAKKRIFLKNKRSKRQIGKIRIVERDPQMPPKNSDEDIFLISRENTYSNVREINTPQRIENGNQDDDIFPLSGEYRIKQKNINQATLDNVYDRQSQNNLMSKYPHIFIDELARARKGFIDENTFNKNEGYRIQPKTRQNNIKQDIEVTTFKDISESKVDEIVNAILPSLSKTKYRVTVKLSPKNITNIGAGFKEIHTSVNKSFDENGLRYFSLVNVSKISKIVKLNETKEILRQSNFKPLNKDLKAQQEQIKTLLELHKERVDQQLENLLRESQHLEQMIKINSKNNISKMTNVLNDESVVTERNNDKIDEVLDSIKKLQETYESITKDKATVTTERTETKLQLIDTIKSNEKITYEILKKIDLNTHILTNFLQMFAEKLSDKNNKTEANIILSKEKNFKQNRDLYSDHNKANNNTDHDQDTENKNNLPQIIYHSDINVVENNNEVNNKKKLEQKNRRIFNQSRFFMDEIENDFKIVANDKQFIGDMNTLNTTIV